MIKNIIFDMGGVLMDFDPKKFVDRYDISDEDKDLLQYKIFGTEYWVMLDWGFITEEWLVEHVCKDTPKRLHPLVKELIYKWDDPALPVEGTADIVKDLKQRGYKIYLLSNAGPRHKEYFKRLPGSEYFDGTVVSSYEKLAKPNPDFYKILFNRFNLKPEECFFIDDNRDNICGSKVVGMDGVVFTGAEDLKLVLDRVLDK